jgi:hypothetical protein
MAARTARGWWPAEEEPPGTPAKYHMTYCNCTEPFQVRWLLYVPPGLTCSNSAFCPHSVFMCFVWISEQTAIISLYSINWLVFIAETECVYCTVRTESLRISQVDLSSYRTPNCDSAVTVHHQVWMKCVTVGYLCIFLSFIIVLGHIFCLKFGCSM